MKNIFFFIKSVILIIPLLLSVAYFTIAERKIMGSIQIRKGPVTIGYLGLLQPLADGAKLFFKELLIPVSSDEFLFLLAPIMSLVLSFMGWLIIPFGYGLFICDFFLGIIFIFAVSSLNVYSLLFAGWSSNSKYSFLGSIRSVSQMISYELSISFCCLILIFCSKTLNLSQFIVIQQKFWFVFPLFPLFIIFFLSILAETNRHPFDLPEAEAELVSGYNVEYSSITFAQFFLGEYSNMLFMSFFSVILFLGGWFFVFFNKFIFDSVLLSLKVLLIVIYFIYNRAILPRFRYDQLMELGWKIFLPLLIGFLFFYIGIIIFLNGFITLIW